MCVCVCVCVCVSKYPSAPACTNSKQLVQKYSTSKCVPERPESTLSVPPWTGSLNPVQYSHLNASLFTVSEVEKVIINLPNNKASGSDGVTYETLKSGKARCAQFWIIYLTSVLRMVKYQKHGKGH